MWPVTGLFSAALRSAHTAIFQVDVWYGGALVTADIDIEGGQVVVHPGQGVRRTLDLSIVDRGLWSTIEPIGTELRPYRGIRYPSGVTELVPLGVFRVDAHHMSVSPAGGITVRSAPDRWSMVQKARFEVPEAPVASTLASVEAARLITEATGQGVDNTATSTATVGGAMVYERDREDVVKKLLTAAGAEGYFDNDGEPVVRDVPLLSQPPVWTVDASESGVLIDGERGRDRSRTYNVAVVLVSVLDGQTPPAPVVVEDDDPTSPTWVGGPMGRVPYFWSSPVMLDTAQSEQAGRAILARVKGTNAQMSLSASVHPGLDRGDVIYVITSEGTVELHMVAGCAIPLSVGGVQPITTVSSWPEGDVPAGE